MVFPNLNLQVKSYIDFLGSQSSVDFVTPYPKSLLVTGGSSTTVTGQDCVGVEYSMNRCEVWTRQQGIEASIALALWT